MAVIDAALPDHIRGRWVPLPQLIDLFAAKLGTLPRRPMLFVSYDVAHPKGYGRQGGVLPDQIFTHFYGSRWPAEMQKPEFADELAWHLAHESAHLYHRANFAQADGDAWIHEGTAEAFAAIALRPTAGAFVQSARDTATSKCAELVEERSIRDAIERGSSRLRTVPLLLNLAVDTKVRTATGSDGLYAVWGNYLRFFLQGSRGAEETLYLEAISEVGGADTAAWLRTAVATPRWRTATPFRSSITSIRVACRNRPRRARPER